jgi:excisionase family DNA binding protein
MRLISTAEVAKRLKLSQRRIQAFIEEGRLPAVRVGQTWVVDEGHIAVLHDRRNGRPIGFRRPSYEVRCPECKRTLKGSLTKWNEFKLRPHFNVHGMDCPIRIVEPDDATKRRLQEGGKL